jgi:hypothetical protein
MQGSIANSPTLKRCPSRLAYEKRRVFNLVEGSAQAAADIESSIKAEEVVLNREESLQWLKLIDDAMASLTRARYKLQSALY